MPKLSVIIPVYNVEKYIRECFGSLINQTFIDFEVVIIDDGSIDNSGAICDEYAQKDSRFKVIHVENGGVSSARNIGLENATGEWVTFIDPDDYMLSSNAYEEILGYTNNARYDAVFFGYYIDDHDNTPKDRGVKIGELNRKDILEMYGGFNNVWSGIYLTKKAKNIQFQPIIVGEDTLWIRSFLLLECENIFTIDKVYYFYRQNEEGITKTFQLSWMADHLYLINQIDEIIKNKNIKLNQKKIRKSKIKMFYYILDYYAGHERIELFDIVNEYIPKYKINDTLEWYKIFGVKKSRIPFILTKLRMNKLLVKYLLYKCKKKNIKPTI